MSDQNDSMTGSYRFEIALSFAGDHKRDRVREIADKLEQRLGEGKVFFDEDFEADFAGLNADVYFQNVYHSQTRLVVSCVCERYSQKVWTKHEWRAIRDFYSGLGENQINKWRFLPIRFDDGMVDGLFPNIDIVPDVREKTTDEIVELILQRHRLCLNNTLIQNSGQVESSNALEVKPGFTSKPSTKARFIFRALTIVFAILVTALILANGLLNQQSSPSDAPPQFTVLGANPGQRFEGQGWELIQNRPHVPLSIQLDVGDGRKDVLNPANLRIVAPEGLLIFSVTDRTYGPRQILLEPEGKRDVGFKLNSMSPQLRLDVVVMDLRTEGLGSDQFLAFPSSGYNGLEVYVDGVQALRTEE